MRLPDASLEIAALGRSEGPQRLRRKVAIKLVLASKVDDPASLRRSSREARADAFEPSEYCRHLRLWRDRERGLGSQPRRSCRPIPVIASHRSQRNVD